MHGVIFSEFKDFVEGMETGAWPHLVKDAGLESEMFLPVKTYADEKLVALLTAASRRSGRSPDALLEGFGKHISASLLRMYGRMIKPHWKLLDVLEHTETTIHRVVRLKDPQATPPPLDCTRTSPGEVVIVYRSPRRLCSLARGIIYGLADHYKQPAMIHEPQCMHRGDGECRLVVHA